MEVRQLPRGRHHLTRAEVTASQRGRMLQAMAEAVRDKGFTGTAVADVVAGAGARRGGRKVKDDLVELIPRFFPPAPPADRFPCEALVAATSSMVTEHVAAGEFDA